MNNYLVQVRHTYLQINGLKHHVCEWGSKKLPKIFFFHGWLDMGASFDFVAQHLEKSFHCIAMDWRGFGYSQHVKSALGYHFMDYLADTHKLLEHYSSHEPVKIVGHSMGGNVTSLYAGSYPERVSHLINIEGFGIRDQTPDEGPIRIRNWIKSMKPHKFRYYANLDPIIAKLCTNNPRLDKKRARFLAKFLCRKTRRGFQVAADPKHKWLQAHIYRLEMIYPYWQNITAKTLLIIAGETEMAKWLGPDTNLETEIDQRLSHFPKSSQRLTLPDCGHMVHHEKPAELAKVIDDFFTN